MYRIDEKKGTVEQIWEYGKKRGHELYSAITSSVEYQADHDSLVVYWASRKLAEGGEPILTEFKRGGQEPVFEMVLKGTCLLYTSKPFGLTDQCVIQRLQ